MLAAACRQPESPPAAAPVFSTTSTVKEIMTAIVDPAADAIWASVATIVTATSREERQPRTDEEWAALRRYAIQLLEAPNLLQMDRGIAAPGETLEDGLGLAPAAIEALVREERATWNQYAQDLHAATLPALEAIDAKNPQGILDAGDGIYRACEACHMRFWYPGLIPPGVVNP